jgi:hypothetical protein
MKRAMRRKNMRGNSSPASGAVRAQLSLETLIVFLVFLSLLALSYSVASKIGAASQSKVASNLASASFDSLASQIESACIGGNGNVRTAEIKGGKASISSEGRDLSFESGNFKASKEFNCEISVAAQLPSSTFTITNNGGTIEIS